MPIIHLTARLIDRNRMRLDREHAPWLFARLRDAFPNALGVTLMPNHPHLVADVGCIDDAYATFVKVLSALTRKWSPGRLLWERVPKPEVVGDPDKVLRAVRYLALNPPRARLTDDPLRWYWSTYRDVCGATADPWISFDRLRPYLPRKFPRDVQQLHRYVSSDPDVHVAGTPLPEAAADTEIQLRPLGEALAAAAAATRGSIEDHRRRGATRTAFVWLAHRQAWRDTQRLADLCGVTRQAITKILRAEPPSSLAAARLCLGDARLLYGIGAPGLCAPEVSRTQTSGIHRAL